jgi:hypothetical protein
VRYATLRAVVVSFALKSGATSARPVAINSPARFPYSTGYVAVLSRSGNNVAARPLTALGPFFLFLLGMECEHLRGRGFDAVIIGQRASFTAVPCCLQGRQRTSPTKSTKWARFVDLGLEPYATSPAEFGKFIVDYTEKWGKVIRAANIKPD